MYRILLILFLFLILSEAKAQHSNTHANMLWFNYNNTVVINNKWSIVNDAQLRTRNWAERWSQFALRSGAVYKLNNKFALTAGFTWFGNVKYFNDRPVVANEWRPWEEVSLQLKQKKIVFFQRLRLEQRFLQKVAAGKKLPDYDFRLRLRYRFEFALPQYKNKFELRLGNEIMGNINHIGDTQFFDQNRTFLILNIKISPQLVFQFQYIKLFQWQPSVNTLDNQDVFRFGIQQQLYLHKPKK